MGVILVIVVIGVLVGAGLFVMSNIVGEAQSGCDVQLNLVLSGNDIVVTILPSADVQYLRTIAVYVDGADASYEFRRVREVSVGIPIVYEDIAVGITGTRFVMVKGTFYDGRDQLLKQSRIQFS